MKSHRDVPSPHSAAVGFVIVLAVAVSLASQRLLAGGSGDSISVTTTTKHEPLTLELLESRRKDAKASKDLDDPNRAKALDFYQHAEDALKAADAYRAKAAESKSLTGRAPKAAEQAKAELKRLREESLLTSASKIPSSPEGGSLGALETAFLQAKASLEGLAKKQADFEKEPTRRANRRKEIRDQLLAVPDQQAELKKQYTASPPQDEPALLTLARHASIQARWQCLEQETPALQAELARLEAEDAVELVRLQRDLLTQKVAIADRQLKLLNEALDKARRAEADHALAEAQRMEADVEGQPLLKSFAAENTKLAEDARQLTKPIESTEKELKEARAELDKLTDQFAKTRQKADEIGLTGPIGQLLRKQRALLPDPAIYQRGVDAGTQAIDNAQFRLYELDEMRASVTNPDPVINSILVQAGADPSGIRRQLLEQAARKVLDSRQKYLDALTRSYNESLDAVLELVITDRKLIAVINNYANYIDERVLWIRSSRPLAMRELFRGRPIYYLVSPENWAQVAHAFASDARSNPLAPLGFVLIVAAFAYLQRYFHTEIERLGREAHRSNFTRFLPSLRAFALTLSTSALGAAIPAYLAWRLAVAAYDIDFPDAVSDGFYQVAWLFWPLDFIRRSCRRDGLAQDHFGWSVSVLRMVAREVRWFQAVALPTVFVIQVLHSSDADTLRNALERVLFAEAMVVISVFLYRVLRPGTGLLRELVAEEHDEWADRVQRVCRWAGIGGALLLAALVIAGYDYTARQLMGRTSQTAVACLAAYYLRALFLRWILIHRRLMGMQEVKERRVTELRSTVTSDANAATVPSEPIPKMDLATLSAQTRTLVNVAILTSLFVTSWWLWSDMFPSVGMLNHWEMWTTTVGDRVEPVTLGNLLSATLIGLMTWIAVRNLPGLLEMTLLQRLPLDTPGRFALSTLGRYTIVIIGLVSASSAIGIGWSKVQWLATAMTFGLAFGLQEIFANFIAGLIILFERPVRVGDMVTIDEVTGVVSRIRIRATTITNSDRKEFIVPNKEFITGRLLNWTLTDTINRVVITVGIAYGSDTDLAQELLLKVGKEHPAVLHDPAPSAGFEEFGDGGLKLVLRCFLPNLSERARVIHELHAGIIRGFAAHGIEIATANGKEGNKPAVPLIVQRAPAPHLGRTG